MSKILMTGVAGFTGRYLAAALSRVGNEVHGISHEAVSNPIEGVADIHICDLNDPESLNAIVAAVQPQKVAHLAAIAFVAHGDVDAIYRTNIVGTRNLLEAVSRAGGAEAVLVASSANIYGNQVGGAIDERCAPAPANDYGVSKLSSEFVAKLYADRLPIIVTRPFNYTGVGQDVSFLIPKIVDKVRRREPRVELGNLDVARDFSDVRDVVNAYVCLLDASRATGEIFNICSGTPNTLQQVLSLVRELSGHDFEVAVNPAFVRTNEVKTLWGDRAKLNAVVDTRPAYSLRDTIGWMLSTDALSL